jgi:hypothetical protein
MLAATRRHRFHSVFFTHVPVANKLDLDAAVCCQTFGALAQLVVKRLREFRIIEDPYFALLWIRGHSTGIADLRQRTEDQRLDPAIGEWNITNN